MKSKIFLVLVAVLSLAFLGACSDSSKSKVDPRNEVPPTVNPPVVNPPPAPDIVDLDRDNVADEKDNCPNNANPDQKDTDNDKLGDVCDLDDDNDGYNDTVEIEAGTNPLDPNSKPSDIDKDGIPDAKDDDADGDGFKVVDGDCNDLDKAFNPAELDPIDDNGVDSNCDGIDGIINPDHPKLGGYPEGVVVSPTGVDQKNCGVNIKAPCRTAAYVFNNMSNAEFKWEKIKYILMTKGTFSGSLEVPKSVSVYGGFCDVTIDDVVSSEASQATTAFVRKRDLLNCTTTIDNFVKLFGNDSDTTVDGLNIFYKGNLGNPALAITEASNPIISRNKILSADAAVVIRVSSVTLTKNEIKAASATTGYAVHITQGKDVLLLDNSMIAAVGYTDVMGIYVKNSSNVIVKGNKQISSDVLAVSGSGQAINMDVVENVTIDDNSVLSSGVQEASLASGITLKQVKEAKIAEGRVLIGAKNTTGAVNIELVGVNVDDVGKLIVSDGGVLFVQIGNPNEATAKSKTVHGIKIINSTGTNKPNVNYFEITNEEINIMGKEAYGIFVSERLNGKLNNNIIYVNGVDGNDDQSRYAYGMSLDGGDHDGYTGNDNLEIKSNDIRVTGSDIITGIMAADGAWKSSLLISDNKIFGINGKELFGAIVNSPDGVAPVIFSGNYIMLFQIKGSGTGARFFRFPSNSQIDNNIIMATAIELDGTFSGDLTGVSLMRMSPALLFNSIGVHVPAISTGKAFAVKSEKMLSSAEVPSIKLIGNVISATSPDINSNPANCRTYGIYAKDGKGAGSYMLNNYFVSKQVAEKPDLYGICFIYKSENEAVELTEVGSINQMTAQCPVEGIDCYDKNVELGKLWYDETGFVTNADMFKKADAKIITAIHDGVPLTMKDVRGVNRNTDVIDIGAIQFSSMDEIVKYSDFYNFEQ